MHHVIVIGGGFGGIDALKVLRRADTDVRVTLIDPKPGFDFLPLLPDVVGLRMRPESVQTDFSFFSRKFRCDVVRDTVTAIHPDRRVVVCGESEISYDFLIDAHGAETNYYGVEDARQRAIPLRSLADVARIRETLEAGQTQTWLVVGGGYSGCEIASQLVRYRRRTNSRFDVVIAEIADTVLPTRPEWMQHYLHAQFDKLNVRTVTGTTLDSYRGDRATLESGEIFDRAAVIWSAGVHVSSLFGEGTVEQADQGRIVVDEALRACERCYVIGDAAHVDDDGAPLFMASYNAAQEGRSAGRNVLRELAGDPPEPFDARKYGFVIPLAHGRGCANAMGMDIAGIVPNVVHHATSINRTPSLGKKLSLVRDLVAHGIG